MLSQAPLAGKEDTPPHTPFDTFGLVIYLSTYDALFVRPQYKFRAARMITIMKSEKFRFQLTVPLTITKTVDRITVTVNN